MKPINQPNPNPNCPTCHNEMWSPHTTMVGWLCENCNTKEFNATLAHLDEVMV